MNSNIDRQTLPGGLKTKLKKKIPTFGGAYCDVSFWPNSQLIFVTVTIVKCLTKYKAQAIFELARGGKGERIAGIQRKILEKQHSSFALYLYSEAINSQFYEHLLMITAGINDLGVWLLASGKRLRNSVGGLITHCASILILVL